MSNKILDFCSKRLWVIPDKDLPWYSKIPVKAIRILVLTVTCFLKNKCTVKASSLTFYTLFSIVPVLALLFGLTSGLGLSAMLYEKIRSYFAKYPAIAEKILDFADSALQNTKSGMIAGIGVILLIWSAVKMLSCIENNLNDIWGIQHGRSLMRKITDYLSILLICPLLMLVAGSIKIYAAARIQQLLQEFPGTEVSSAIQVCNGLLPLIVVWLVFTFLYAALPNTKVHFSAAAIAAFFAALVYTGLQSLYIFTQYTTARFNAVYGSFAAFPLLLMWLNLSWIIILAGAQLSFSIQNYTEFEMLPISGELSQLQRYIYAMEIIAFLSVAFKNGTGPVTDEELSVQLRLPIRTVRQLLDELRECGILSEAVPVGKRGVWCSQVARPVEDLTPAFLIQALGNLHGYEFQNELDKQYLSVIEKMYEQFKTMPVNIPIYKSFLEFKNK